MINPLQIRTKRYSPSRALHYATSEHHTDSDREIYFECLTPDCKAGKGSLIGESNTLEPQKSSFVLKKGELAPKVEYPIDKSCPECGEMSLIRSA